LLFSIINLSVGPIISKRVGDYWGTLNCEKAKDDYDKVKDQDDPDNDIKYNLEYYMHECQREKAMHDMEYTSFIFDIVIGFVCGLLGLLHLFELKKEFVPKTGLIGLGCGIVGFVLSFIYVVYNGIVYTNYYDNNYIYKRNSDGAFAERVEAGKYECFYFDEKGNYHALTAKFSDYIQKQYNYDKDVQAEFYDDDSERSKCSWDDPFDCKTTGYISTTGKTYNGNQCKYLYVENSNSIKGVTNKDKSDRFLTTLLLSLFVCLANIGLGLFGFLLYRTPGEF
jgi:hypothetical protein